MINPFNRYKHHHNILYFLVEQDRMYNNCESNKRHNIEIDFKPCFISEKFNITENKATEILTELRNDKFLNWDKHKNKYNAADSAYRAVKLNSFRYKESEYNSNLFLNNSKDILMIIVSVLGIISFFITVNRDVTHIEQLEKEQSNLNKLLEDNQKQLIEVKQFQLETQKKFQDTI